MAKRNRRIGLVLSDDEWQLFEDAKFEGRFKSVADMIRHMVAEGIARQREAQKKV